jgi:single-stranded DNA-binding protein
MNANQITIVGRITEPEVMAFEKAELVTASLAFVDGRETGWIGLKAWNETGESLSKLAKGSMVMVTGKLTVSNFTTKDGRKASKLYLTVQSIQQCEQTYKIVA